MNAVATAVLAGELNLENAKVYASLARTIAQTMSAEVTRSRFLQTMPDLSLDGDIFEEDEA